MGKSIWVSKTFWFNVFSAIGMLAGHYAGFTLTPELIAAWLVIINLILRLVTKEEIDW